jgi:xanthosine utilization system XapX-like protein
MKNNTILAIIAILVGATTLATTGSTIVRSALAQATDNATMAENMTGGNMTMGTDNSTAANMTEAVGQISGGGGRCGGTCYSDTD